MSIKQLETPVRKNQRGTCSPWIRQSCGNACEHSFSSSWEGLKQKRKPEPDLLLTGASVRIKMETSNCNNAKPLTRYSATYYLKQVNSGSVDVSSLTTTHEIAFQNAIRLFDRRTERMQNLGGQNFVQKYRDRLQKTADDILKSKLLPLEQVNTYHYHNGFQIHLKNSMPII